MVICAFCETEHEDEQILLLRREFDPNGKWISERLKCSLTGVEWESVRRLPKNGTITLLGYTENSRELAVISSSSVDALASAFDDAVEAMKNLETAWKKAKGS